MDSPKRAFEVRIEVGGDTIEDALKLIKSFARAIQEGSGGGVSGGYSSGGIYEATHRPEQTHEKWWQDMEEWEHDRTRPLATTTKGETDDD